ncbi:MAG: hypothetical protein V1887_01560 [Candidatus Aenigmatarchaeota archaeon]
MIWKKSKGKCRDCDASIQADWDFCPRCGVSVKEKDDMAPPGWHEERFDGQNENDMAPSRGRDGQDRNDIAPFHEPDEQDVFGLSDIFGQIEKQMQQQMQDMDRMFGQEMFAKPRIIVPKGGSGISISINSSQGGEPKISVKTFGNAKKMEPQIMKELGVRNGGEEKIERPKMTAEPEMTVKNEKGKQVYTIALPDVKDERNIKVNRMPNSIEVRAKAGDKLYFKLFEVQPQLSIAEQKFSNGKLTLVLEK